MLSIRLEHGLTMHLDRKLTERSGYGIWSFHASESSWAIDQGRKTLRFARIKPAEPGPGKEVEVFVIEGPDAPEEAHLGPHQGVVVIV